MYYRKLSELVRLAPYRYINKSTFQQPWYHASSLAMWKAGYTVKDGQWSSYFMEWNRTLGNTEQLYKFLMLLCPL